MPSLSSKSSLSNWGRRLKDILIPAPPFQPMSGRAQKKHIANTQHTWQATQRTMQNIWEISRWSFGWTSHLYFNPTLVRGPSKGTMASTVAAALANNNAFDAWVGEMMEHSTTLLFFTRPINTGFSTRTMQSNTWKEHIGMTRLLVQHLLYHSKGEMLRWEQSKGHGKGTRSKSSLPI